MPNVAQGATASYTFPTAQTVTFTLDQGERAVINVTRSGSLIANRSISNGETIGPYQAGDVMAVTALRGAVDYDVATYTSPVSGDGVVLPAGGEDTEFAAAAAMAIASTGGTVLLTPGATYTSTRGWSLAGIRLIGNGATIRRAPQPTWTTSTTLTSGSTTVIVLDAAASDADLKVGDTIMAVQGLRYSGRATVQAIAVDRRTITLTAPIAVGSTSIAPGGRVIEGPLDTSWTLSGSTTIARVWWTVDAADAILIDDVVIDGNRAQAPYGKWDTSCELRTKRLQCLGKVEVKNGASEGILSTADSTDSLYAFSASSTPWAENGAVGPVYVHDCGGNGLHFSGTTDITIRPGSRFARLNSDPSVGHVGGGLCYSWGGRNLTVSGCFFDDCYAAIGFAGVPASSILRFIGNDVGNMHRYMLFATGGTAYHSSNFIIHGNTGINAGDLLITGSAGNKRFRGLVVTGNVFTGSTMRFEQVDSGVVAKNVLDCRSYTPTTTTAAVTSGSTTSVTVASTTGYSVGDTIRFVKGAQVSQPVTITGLSGGIQWERPITDSIASGADVVRDDLRAMGVLTVYPTTGDTSVTFRNAGLFKPNHWLTLYNTSAGASTTRVRIAAINYATGVATLDGTIDRTYSAGTTLASYGSLIDDTGVIRSESSEITVAHNTVRGQAFGIFLSGAHSAKMKILHNTVTDYRGNGINGSSTANSYEEITGNTVTAVAGVSATWGNAIICQSKQTARGNLILAPASTHDNAMRAIGSGAVLDGNVIRVGGGSAPTGSALRLTGGSNVAINTMTNGTVVDAGTNTVAGTQTIPA